MAEGIVYLDADDEITSAASRIRTAAGTKVAIVIPYGSRIATSRINFRLLSREALVSNRRLSVIAGDPASRALAASAGLPVFATIAEYEAALAGPKPAVDDDPIIVGAEAPETPDAEVRAAPVKPPRSKRARGAATGAAATGAATTGTAAAAGAAAAGVTATRSAEGASAPTPAADDTGFADETRPIAIPTRPRAPLDHEPETGPTDARMLAAGEGGRRVGTPALVTLAAIALAVIVVGVAAYLLLPSATIAVTPRQDPIGPIALTISADPSATAVDPANSVIPANHLDVPVEASQTFTTTGRHVEQAPASGSVTFSNYDPTASNTIQAGSIVSTEGGIRFRTQATVTVPAGTFVLPSVIPSRRSVSIEAVKDGPDGNVPANAIRIVPPVENPEFLKVNNPDPTSGGTRTETPEVSKPEVDKAVAALQKTLQANLTAAVEAGAGAPPGTRLFPTTADLGTPTFDVDPMTLVGQALETFDLRISTTGSVISVDPAPVRVIAEAQIRAKVAPDHELVTDSIQMDVDDGSVGEDGQVTFQGTARAMQVIVVDAGKVRGLVKGKTAAEAEAALAPYGAARVSLWPAWVTTVTGVDARLSISVASQAGNPGSGASTSPDASGSTGP